MPPEWWTSWSAAGLPVGFGGKTGDRRIRPQVRSFGIKVRSRRSGKRIRTKSGRQCPVPGLSRQGLRRAKWCAARCHGLRRCMVGLQLHGRGRSGACIDAAGRGRAVSDWTRPPPPNSHPPASNRGSEDPLNRPLGTGLSATNASIPANVSRSQAPPSAIVRRVAYFTRLIFRLMVKAVGARSSAPPHRP